MCHNPEKQVLGRQNSKYSVYVEETRATCSQKKMKSCVFRPESEKKGGVVYSRMNRLEEANSNRILSHWGDLQQRNTMFTLIALATE